MRSRFLANINSLLQTFSAGICWWFLRASGSSLIAVFTARFGAYRGRGLRLSAASSCQGRCRTGIARMSPHKPSPREKYRVTVVCVSHRARARWTTGDCPLRSRDLQARDSVIPPVWVTSRCSVFPVNKDEIYGVHKKFI